MPSLLDPSLAPPGRHVIHAYTAGNEPYDIWARFKNDRKNPEYEKLKEVSVANEVNLNVCVFPFNTQWPLSFKRYFTPFSAYVYYRSERHAYGLLSQRKYQISSLESKFNWSARP